MTSDTLPAFYPLLPTFMFGGDEETKPAEGAAEGEKAAA